MVKLPVVLILIMEVVNSINSQCPKASITTTSGTHAPPPNQILCPGELIFEDNFNTLDLKKWQHELTLGGGGNWEFQWYTNSRYNSYTENGKLYIKPTLVADEMGEKFLFSGQVDINGGSPADACTNPQWYGCARTGTAANALNPIKSARIRTVNSFSFKYGKVEVSAKLPSGDWLWPAIWLLPRWNQYSTWPTSGEIDMMESRGNRNYSITKTGQQIGNQLVGSTLHWGPAWNINKYNLTHFEKNNPAGWDSGFHKYQLEWSPDSITFKIDDAVVGTVAPPAGGFWELGHLNETSFKNPWRSGTKMAPFDQEYYVLINLACGGISYFPDPDGAKNAGGKPWSNTEGTASSSFWKGKDQWLPTWKLDTETAAFQIDYVKIWAL